MLPKKKGEEKMYKVGKKFLALVLILCILLVYAFPVFSAQGNESSITEELSGMYDVIQDNEEIQEIFKDKMCIRDRPVRGQRTKTNARTRKGPKKTIANKKK